jgi:hypothetical protein
MISGTGVAARTQPNRILLFSHDGDKPVKADSVTFNCGITLVEHRNSYPAKKPTVLQKVLRLTPDL